MEEINSQTWDVRDHPMYMTRLGLVVPSCHHGLRMHHDRFTEECLGFFRLMLSAAGKVTNRLLLLGDREADREEVCYLYIYMAQFVDIPQLQRAQTS